MFDNFKLPDFSEPVFPISEYQFPEIDPDDFAPNRTANNTDQMLELLQLMKESAERESKAQHRRFVVEIVLSVISILIAAVAAVCAAYPLFPQLLGKVLHLE